MNEEELKPNAALGSFAGNSAVEDGVYHKTSTARQKVLQT